MTPSGRRPGGDEAAAASLTGGGPSQLGVGGSMRARDVSRPSADDVAAAEELVQVSFRPRSRPVRPSPTPAPAPSPGHAPADPGGQPPGTAGSSPDAS